MQNGNPYRPLHSGTPYVTPMYQGLERFSAGLEEPQWIHCDEWGNVKMVPADRQRLLVDLKVPYRDLRMLDPSVDIPHPTSIFVRAEAIIVNFESIRMLIAYDRALVLSVPKPGRSLLHGMAPRPQSPYVRHLARRVRPHGSMEEDVKEGLFDSSLPFELRCLEAALDTAISLMTDETAALEQHVSPAQLYMSHRVTRFQLEELRDLRSEQSKLASRVSKLKQELNTVLASDTEIKMMTLTDRRRQRLEAAQPVPSRLRRRTSSVAFREAGTPPLPPSAMRRPGGGSAETASAAAAAVASSDSGELHGFTPQGDEKSDLEEAADEETPEGELHQSLQEVHSMLQTMQSFKINVEHHEQSPTWQVVSLLDTNLMTVEHLVQRLEVLKERIISTEKFIDSELDRSRNELVVIEIVVTAVTMGFSFVSCVGGLFGMNLVNGKEESHVMFVLVTSSSVVVGVLLCALVVLFAYKRQLLSVPDAKEFELSMNASFDSQS